MSRLALIRSAVALVILIASALAASTWPIYSHTWDEPEHLAAGLELLDRGKYEYDTEHPPLARVLIALGPYLAGAHSFGTPPPSGVQEGIDILYDGGHYDRTLTLARLGALPFLAVLLSATWLWAARVARSREEALLAVILLATVPPVIGHAALAALDVPGTATTLLALYLLQKWLLSRHAADAVLFGLATGVAVATKLSAVPYIALGMIGLTIVQWCTRSSREASVRLTWRGRSGQAALWVISSLLPIFLAYGPRSVELTHLPPRFQWVLPYLLRNDPAPHPGVYWIFQHLPLPQAFWDLAEGVMALKAHNDTGHFSFLLGQVKSDGWWYFYLVDLAVKTPLPLLAAGFTGLMLLARDGWRQRDPWRLAPGVLLVLILTFASGFSRINIGIRHVLILYPWLALGGAYAFAHIWRAAGRWQQASRRIAARAAVAGLIGWQLLGLALINPDYLPYFNELARHPEHIVVDSDLDWGQDMRRLRIRLRQLKVPSISLAYQGTADLAREGLPPWQLLGPGHPTSGWVAITALVRGNAHGGYAWLDAYQPRERIGKTIDLYFIPPAPGDGSAHRPQE